MGEQLAFRLHTAASYYCILLRVNKQRIPQLKHKEPENTLTIFAEKQLRPENKEIDTTKLAPMAQWNIFQTRLSSVRYMNYQAFASRTSPM